MRAVVSALELSFRDFVEMMAERGLRIADTKIIALGAPLRSGIRTALESLRPAGASWRMDETYIKVRGKWVYQYSAVDLGSFGPAGTSATALRRSHVATVSGLMPQRLARSVRLSDDAVSLDGPPQSSWRYDGQSCA